MNSEEQPLIFNSILISTPSIVYTYDVENSRIHFLNDGIYDQLGFPKSEIKTMHLDEFLGKMPSSDQHRYKSHIEAVLLGREKKFTAFDYRLQKRNGDWKWFSDTIYRLARPPPAPAAAPRARNLFGKRASRHLGCGSGHDV